MNKSWPEESARTASHPPTQLPTREKNAGADEGRPGLEAILDDQSRRWQRGEKLLVESFLAEQPALREDPEAVLDLIYHEVVLRQAQGEAVDVEEYIRRFPDWAAQLRLHFQVHRAIDPTSENAVSTGSITYQVHGDISSTTPIRVHGGWPSVPGYEIEAEIGQGGMGVVYRARHRALNRVVALKMALGAAHLSARETSRFRREAEMVAQLQHPHIVQIYEVGEHDGRPFYSMEFVGGGSLDRLVAGTPQSPREAAQLVETLARAMYHAHERGIIHRDLKPANILLVSGGVVRGESSEPTFSTHHSPLTTQQPKITDFGLAKFLWADVAGPTRSGDLLGTPSYMAPEQIDFKTGVIGPASDVYGLGAILYELLTGRPPFKAETAMDTLLQVKFTDPVSPSQLQPKLSRDLVTICLHCLHKEPRQRYASALALAEDLRSFLDGRPIRARPVGVLARTVKWARRRPAIAALGAGIFLILALGFAGVTWQWREAEGARRTAEGARRTAEDRLYFNRIALAHHEWLAYNVARAGGLLAECPEHRRQWEWHYLQRLCSSDLLTLRDHTGEVASVAFSPDGQFLASATGHWDSKDPGEIKIWDAATGRKLVDCAGPDHAVFQIAFSPDGRSLASAGLDGMVRCWDVQTGKEQFALRAHKGWVMGVAFSPDGRRLASASADRTVIVWDLATRQPLRHYEKHTDMVFGVAFSADGRLLASCSRDWTVRVWDTSIQPRGQVAVPLHTLHGIVDVRCVAFSPDGRRLAAGGYDHTLKVWNLGNPTAVDEVFTNHAHSSPICYVGFRPDGQLVSSDGKGTVRFWDAQTGVALWSLRGHSGGVRSVAFSSNGRFIATGSSDRTVKVWDATTEQQAVALISGESSSLAKGPVAFSSDSQYLAAAMRDGPFGNRVSRIRIWDIQTVEVTHTLRGPKTPATSVIFSPDGQYLAAAFGELVKVWDLRTEKEVASRLGDAPVLSVAFRSDGQRLWVASGDRSVKVWDALTGAEPRTLAEPMNKITGGTLSGDGQCLAVADDIGTVRVWETETGREVGEFPYGAEVTRIAFSLDRRRLAVATAANTVMIQEVAGSTPTITCRGHTGRVTSLAFSADGQRLASTSHDGTVILWDTRTGQEAITLRGHREGVLNVAVSADGQRLASTSSDCQLMVWVAGEQPAEEKAARLQGKNPLALAWHRREAKEAEDTRQWFAVNFHLSRLIDAAPGSSALHARRGRAFAALGQFDLAARDVGQVFESRFGDLSLRHDHALVCLAVGDQARYCEVCAGILAEFGATESAGDANGAAWTCVLGPSATKDLTQPVRLAEKAVASERIYNYLNTLGIALYRAGRLDLAIQRLNEAIQLHGEGGTVIDWLFLAMAHHRQGKQDEARKWLDKAALWIDNAPEARSKEATGYRQPWNERLEIQLFRHEAETLLKGAKP
jgi:WD40 repeat protein/tetratricopeptide (TPR) repeat protein